MGNTLYEVFKANSSNSNLLMSTNQLGQKHIKFSTLILHVIGYGKNKINALQISTCSLKVLSCTHNHLSCTHNHLSCTHTHLSCTQNHLSCTQNHLSFAQNHLSGRQDSWKVQAFPNLAHIFQLFFMTNFQQQTVNTTRLTYNVQSHAELIYWQLVGNISITTTPRLPIRSQSRNIY